MLYDVTILDELLAVSFVTLTVGYLYIKGDLFKNW
jgi:hypothetical protein